MNFTGLSLEQAPPLNAPARFFITAPIFGMIAALLIFWTDPALLSSRFSIESIVITHLFTIGIFSMVMLGALQQMLPVLAGVSLPRAAGVAAFSHAALVLGVFFMSIGLWQNDKSFTIMAAIGLGLGFVSMLTAIALAMKKITFFTPTVKAMMTAVAFAFTIVLIGLHLLGAYAAGNIGNLHMALANTHSVWAIFGFVGILIIGVAFQVLPMFYVTPHFRKFYNNVVIPLIMFGLSAWMVSQLFLPEFAITGKFVIGLFFLAFATAIIKKLKERRRPVIDVTVWYWILAAVSLASGMILWVADAYMEADHIMIVAVLIGGGFILSVMNGMLYKIIPFLAWFHLNASGYMSIPTMREMIHERMAKVQFVLHLLSLVFFIAFFWIPVMVKVAAAALFFSMLLLEINLLIALNHYRVIKKREPDFNMEGMK